MKAVIKEEQDGRVSVSINGDVFYARHVIHTRGPVMMVAMPNRTVYGFYDLQTNDAFATGKPLRIAALASAVEKAGFEVEVL